MVTGRMPPPPPQQQQQARARARAPLPRRRPDGALWFGAEHADFRPNLTPAECIQRGIFGGIYFNPRGGRPGILGPSVDVDAAEFPRAWFRGLPVSAYAGRRYDAAVNRYGVVAGKDQAYWESRGWIDPQDPRGWFQWYCRFYLGRRTADDARQIARWAGVAGERGRWRRFLLNRVAASGRPDGDETVSPVVRQTLLHWAYELPPTPTT